jgi:hypothetical protein
MARLYSGECVPFVCEVSIHSSMVGIAESIVTQARTKRRGLPQIRAHGSPHPTIDFEPALLHRATACGSRDR